MKHAIDVGTSTLKTASVSASGELFSADFITALGAHFSASDELSEAGLQRLFAALSAALSHIRSLEAAGGAAASGAGVAAFARELVLQNRLVCAGTAAFRRASNRAQIITALREKFGLQLRVLSQQEEAEISLAGAAAGCEDLRVFLDVGGGSSELSVCSSAYINRLRARARGGNFTDDLAISSDRPRADDFCEKRGFCLGAGVSAGNFCEKSRFCLGAGDSAGDFCKKRGFSLGAGSSAAEQSPEQSPEQPQRVLLQAGLLSLLADCGEDFAKLSERAQQVFGALPCAGREVFCSSKALIYAQSLPKGLKNYEINDYDFHNQLVKKPQLLELIRRINALSEAEKFAYFDAAKPGAAGKSERAAAIKSACAILLAVPAAHYRYCAHALKEGLLNWRF